MSSVVTDLEQHLEAEDGVVEVERVMPFLTVPWSALAAGPRRWAPTDLSVEVEDGAVSLVRLTYRTVGDRVVVVAGAQPSADVDHLAQQLATPLLFSYVRKTLTSLPAEAIMSSVRGAVEWDSTPGEGWQFGQAGLGTRPVRLARLSTSEGHIVVAAHGVAPEEVTTMVANLIPLEAGSEAADDLHVRHRRALAQRWWDAPRTPWTPSD